MNQPSVPKPVKSVGRGPGSLFAGVTYPLRALWLLIKHAQLRKYVLVPILVNVLLGITLYAGLLWLGLQAIDALLANLPMWTADLSQEISGEISGLTTHLPNVLPSMGASLSNWQIYVSNWHFPDLHFPNWLPHLPQWQIHFPTWSIQLPDWLTNWTMRLPDWASNLSGWGLALFVWVLRVLLVLLLLVVTGFILLQFGVLLGSPWYGKLSEEIETLQTGKIVLVEVPFWVEVGRAIAFELKKIALTIVVGVPLLVFNFFPGLGTLVASVAGIALASTIVCLDFFDAAVERRRPRFRQKLRFVFRSLPASASFGLVCLGLVSIPFINLLAIPVCVAAGTLFFCDRILPQFPESALSTYPDESTSWENKQ